MDVEPSQTKRRSLSFFIALLLVAHVYLLWHHAIVPLVEVAIILNATVCGWYVWNAFAQPGRAVVIRKGVQAVVIALILTLNGTVFMGAYIRLWIAKHPVVTLAQAAPDISWTAFDGSRHTLTEFKGHGLVLHFWATWCSPCRIEFPKFVAYAAHHPETNFLAIDSGDIAEKADRFVAQAGAAGVHNLFFARDPDSTISSGIFKGIGFPTTILIDAGGQMRLQISKSVEWDGQEIDSQIESLKASH